MAGKKKSEELNLKKEFERLKKEKEKSTRTISVNMLNQVATREIIERDYQEDVVPVTFETAPGIKRTILARRPTYNEMLKIIKLSIISNKVQNSTNPDDIEKMVNVVSELSEFATKLSVDESLDKEFWENKISYPALQDFIAQLISISLGTPQLPDEEIKNFR